MIYAATGILVFFIFKLYVDTKRIYENNELLKNLNKKNNDK